MEEQTRSWWHTMPGMLTGAAAVITAVTGLFLAANQAGWLRREQHTAEPAALQADLQTAERASDGGTKAAGMMAAPGSSALKPAVTEVTLGDVQLTLLDVRNEQRNPETNGLRIAVRFYNRGPYPANFWNASFRLLVDGIPRAPTGDLNKVVEGHSAQEGDVEFTVPAKAASLVLQIRIGEETTEIALQR